jgi:flagellar hook-associated protein 2
MVTITANFDSVVNLIQKIITAFNDTTGWIAQQTSSASDTAGSIGRDPLVRGLRSQLTGVITADYDLDGAYSALAELGFEFSRTGQLSFDESRLRDALKNQRGDVEALFRGNDGAGGAFGALESAIEEYTKAGGLVPSVQDRLSGQVTQLSDRIADMEDRLAIRKAALQREYAAVDATMAQLNSQKDALSSLGSQYSLF